MGNEEVMSQPQGPVVIVYHQRFNSCFFYCNSTARSKVWGVTTFYEEKTRQNKIKTLT